MKNKFIEATLASFDREIIKKLVFSRPHKSETKKVSARLCAHRGQKLLAFEYFLPGDTVSHKNIKRDGLYEFILELLAEYGQANLITTLGECEWKLTKKSEITLGADSLLRKMTQDTKDFERAIEALDKEKNHILTGNEDFLIELGVSDKTGRVHDKRQGKFRQINRFLEHIEEIYQHLPADDTLTVYDLCCGKSYLSFAVYYYLTVLKSRKVRMLGVDLKRDVISWCERTARALGYCGMQFISGDISELAKDADVDMVISLHACDVATDIVLNTAGELGAGVILSTPCCHRHINDKIMAKELSFVTEHPQLRGKLAEAITDAIRLARLKKFGYDVCAKELTDPENTPKNTLLIAIKKDRISADEIDRYSAEYEGILDFVLGDKKQEYLQNI